MNPKKMSQAEYIQFGFCPSDDNSRPQCVVVCSMWRDVIKRSNEADKTDMHVQSKHPNIASRSVQYFQTIRDHLHNNERFCGYADLSSVSNDVSDVNLASQLWLPSSTKKEIA